MYNTATNSGATVRVAQEVPMAHIPLARYQHRHPDRAVSPVIGVVLMVAITIILAAIIGTFVLGLSPGSSQVAPLATVTFDDSGNLTMQHEGGDTLDLDEFTLLADGEDVTPEDFTESFSSGQSKEFSLDDENITGPVELVLRHDPSGELVARQEVTFP